MFQLSEVTSPVSRLRLVTLLLSLELVFVLQLAQAQTAPSIKEIATYHGLHRAAHDGDVEDLLSMIADGGKLEARDGSGRTALHVAAFASHEPVVQALARAGADLNSLEYQAYDIVTIASVANDLDMLDTALDLGASAGNITSPYDGTALIAAAHLGHHQIVERLIRSEAPLDHVNNLEWTALIEAVVLGDGGKDHTETVKLLLEAGADQGIGDRDSVTPLEHAQSRGYVEMIKLFEKYGQ